MTLTPLDTCGAIYLDHDDYAAVRDTDARLPRLIMENYRAWARSVGAEEVAARRSTTLYDTVAVYLAFASEPYLAMEEVELDVEDDGLTFERSGGRAVCSAMAWRDLDGFKRFLIDRLTGYE